MSIAQVCATLGTRLPPAVCLSQLDTMLKLVWAGRNRPVPYASIVGLIHTSPSAPRYQVQPPARPIVRSGGSGWNVMVGRGVMMMAGVATGAAVDMGGIAGRKSVV